MEYQQRKTIGTKSMCQRATTWVAASQGVGFGYQSLFPPPCTLHTGHGATEVTVFPTGFWYSPFLVFFYSLFGVVLNFFIKCIIVWFLILRQDLTVSLWLA